MEKTLASEFAFGPKRHWRVLVSFAALLGALELVAVTLVSRSFFSTTGAAVALVAAASFTAMVLVACVSPLWGTVRVRGGLLRVRFGLLSSLDVPLQRLKGVRSVPSSADDEGFGIDFVPESETLKLSMSSHVQLVRFAFDEALIARLLHRRIRVKAATLSLGEDANAVVAAIEAHVENHRVSPDDRAPNLGRERPPRGKQRDQSDV